MDEESDEVTDRPPADSAGPWFLYLIRCRGGHLYTGITTDVERRLQEHAESPRGARFLRGRGPLILAFQAAVGSRGDALKAEYRVKQLRRVQKEALVRGQIDLLSLVSQSST
jgi:putative endonuclease